MEGPILFALYLLPLKGIADDTQLYLSIKPDNTQQLFELRECFKDKDLKRHKDKTEVIVLGPKILRNTASNQMLTLADFACSLVSSDEARSGRAGHCYHCSQFNSAGTHRDVPADVPMCEI